MCKQGIKYEKKKKKIENTEKYLKALILWKSNPGYD